MQVNVHQARLNATVSLHFTSLVTCWSSRKAMPMETCKLFFRLTTFLVLSCQEIAYCKLPNINCWESGAFCVSTNHKLAESWHLLLFAVPSLAVHNRVHNWSGIPYDSSGKRKEMPKWTWVLWEVPSLTCAVLSKKEEEEEKREEKGEKKNGRSWGSPCHIESQQVGSPNFPCWKMIYAWAALTVDVKASWQMASIVAS